MSFSVKRFRSRMKAKAYVYVRCGAKTAAFLFWASLYMVVMKMTVFKSKDKTPVKDWSMLPDNYSRWMLQSPVILDKHETESVNDNIVWSEPDNETLLELEKRAETVNEVCRKRNLLSQPINNKEFFVDSKHKLIWCNIFKAASSSWMYYFNILGGYEKKFLATTKKFPLILARIKFPRPSIKKLKEALNTPGAVSLLIVREPFVRLLSAYRDKLETKIKPFYRKLASFIIKKYRNRKIKDQFRRSKSLGPTFCEFVQYLIDQYNSVGYVPDEHWAPYHTFCSPCAVYFNVIAKVETLAKDSMYVIHQLGLGHMISIVGERSRAKQRVLMNQSRDGKNTAALLRHYFGQLDERLLNQLLKIYGIDFEMFGYDADVYKSYIRK